jgi:hypothetical protein
MKNLSIVVAILVTFCLLAPTTIMAADGQEERIIPAWSFKERMMAIINSTQAEVRAGEKPSNFRPQVALSVRWYSAGTCHPASFVASQNVNDNTCTTPPASVGGPQYKASCPGNPNETYTKYSGTGCTGTPTGYTGSGCFSISGKYVIISSCP